MSEFEIPDDWTPQARAELARRLSKVQKGGVQRWYCDRPRTCDGQPHGLWTYKHARGDQWPPADNAWLLWEILSGRGSGKTRTGAEWMREISPRVGRMAMIGRRGVDIRATMVEGDSGLIRVCELAGEPYDWQPSKKEFTFTKTGSKIFGYSGEEPDALRGPQHGAAWLDEPAHIALIQEVWDNLLFGLRLPGMPGGAKVLATSTPLPTKWVKETSKDPRTRVVRASTYANLDNLDPAYRQIILEKYEGTRLGRQELHGEILEDVVGSLWNTTMFKRANETFLDMERVVVAIDPAGTANRKSDETGIIVVGQMGDSCYVLADFTDKYSPAGWSNRAVQAFETFGADAIVAEKNFGGDMVKSTIMHAIEGRDSMARVIITTASRSKQLRAEPVVGLYEQGRVYHAKGLAALENEMASWVPGVGASPNRVDALVWGVTELMKYGNRVASIASPSGRLTQQATLPGTRRSFRRSVRA